MLNTPDWTELMCVTALCNRYKKTSIEEFGYRKGYTYLVEAFSRLLAAPPEVISAGFHVVVTAYEKMRKFKQPGEMPTSRDHFSDNTLRDCVRKK